MKPLIYILISLSAHNCGWHDPKCDTDPWFKQTLAYFDSEKSCERERHRLQQENSPVEGYTFYYVCKLPRP